MRLAGLSNRKTSVIERRFDAVSELSKTKRSWAERKRRRFVSSVKTQWTSTATSTSVSFFSFVSLVLSVRLLFTTGDVFMGANIRGLESTWSEFLVAGWRYDIIFQVPIFGRPSGTNPNFILVSLDPGERGDVDYGGLDFDQRKSFHFPRAIGNRDYEDDERDREILLAEVDQGSGEDWAQPDSSKEDEDPQCRKASWASYTFPTCNEMHEQPIERFQYDGFEVSYLNSGSYRDAFRFQRQFPANHFVMKRMKAKRSIGAPDIHKTRKEAMFFERLSASRRILDIYSYCGTSVLVEPMAGDVNRKIVLDDDFYVSQETLDAEDDAHPRNNLTTSEKLHIALEMARSLAELHGFEGGPIVHADTHIDQWLISLDGYIKLNDFGDAVEPKWNDQTQKLCPKTIHFSGLGRSPEELDGAPQSESVDTFSFGSTNIYTLITGLWPFYDEQFRGESRSKIRREIIAGKRPFVDPRYRIRSFIEGKLVEVMERCWTQSPADRPEMFEVVSWLEKIEEEAIKKGELHASSLINIPI